MTSNWIAIGLGIAIVGACTTQSLGEDDAAGGAGTYGGEAQGGRVLSDGGRVLSDGGAVGSASGGPGALSGGAGGSRELGGAAGANVSSPSGGMPDGVSGEGGAGGSDAAMGGMGGSIHEPQGGTMGSMGGYGAVGSGGEGGVYDFSCWLCVDGGCHHPVCGDGILDRAICDWSDCSPRFGPAPSDAIRVEECDDGNQESGDGCSPTCRIEPRFVCRSEGGMQCRPTVCGDGVRESTETCDDSNTEAGDGCDADCTIEPGWACKTPSECHVIQCGDAIRDVGEACDDGNATSGDGCSACSVESGWECLGNTTCEPTGCGNGINNADERCDDGNTTSLDGCSATCQLESGWYCGIAPEPCALQVCGDGVRVGREQCDDGHLIHDNDGGEGGSAGAPMRVRDGCSNNCRIEAGWVCETPGTPCRRTVCGDGVLEYGESCDDGNLASSDGCSPDCLVERGWRKECTETEPGNETCALVPVVCGDGVLEFFYQERCDDGNAISGDGCSATCAIERGWHCSSEGTDCVEGSCGDAVIDDNEECDDGNTVADDGCYDCKVEGRYCIRLR